MSGSTQKTERIREKVGTRLKEARKRRGLTQKEVQDDTGLHSNTLRRYERGETDIPLPRLVMLSEYLECPLAQILQDLSEDQAVALDGSKDNSGSSKPWIRERLSGRSREIVIDLHKLLNQSKVEVVVTGS